MKRFNKKEKYKNGIAKIGVKGFIGGRRTPMRMSYGASCNPESVIENLDLAEEDQRIKGLIIEINSPGGYIVGSSEIAEKISSLTKPRIALVRETAASGAYLVASACQAIVAHKMSSVGSIGVLLPMFDCVEFIKKLGIKYKSFKAGEYKDIGMPFRTLSEKEEGKLQNLVDESYDDFIKEIAKYRNLSEEKVRGLADGFILLGKRAKDAGLIDEIGGLQTAITFCEKRGNFEHDRVVERKESLTERISSMFGRTSYNIGLGIANGILQRGYDLRIQ